MKEDESKHLFAIALGLQNPGKVKSPQVSVQNKQAKIRIGFACSSAFP